MTATLQFERERHLGCEVALLRRRTDQNAHAHNTKQKSQTPTARRFGVDPSDARARANSLTDLSIAELVENRRRAVAMLPSGAPALDRDEALELLEQFKAALLELRKLRAEVARHGDR